MCDAQCCGLKLIGQFAIWLCLIGKETWILSHPGTKWISWIIKVSWFWYYSVGTVHHIFDEELSVDWFEQTGHTWHCSKFTSQTVKVSDSCNLWYVHHYILSLYIVSEYTLENVASHIYISHTDDYLYEDRTFSDHWKLQSTILSPRKFPYDTPGNVHWWCYYVSRSLARGMHTCTPIVRKQVPIFHVDRPETTFPLIYVVDVVQPII